MGFSRQECWSGLSCPPSGDRPDPGIESMSPTLEADSSSFEPLGKSHKVATKRSNRPKHWKMQCYETLPGHGCLPIGHSATGWRPRMPHLQVLFQATRAHRTHAHHGVAQLQAPQAFVLMDSVILWTLVPLKGKFVLLANISLVNKHTKRRIMPLNACSKSGASSLGEKARLSRIRTSQLPPEALMLEENVKVAFPGLTLPEVTRDRTFPGKERRGMKGQGIPAMGVGGGGTGGELDSRVGRRVTVTRTCSQGL